jgi:transcriptional regulator with XRE-family HTH domain
MAKKWAAVREKMTRAQKTKSRIYREEMIRQLPLEGVREARNFTQTNLAGVLKVSQGSISKVERRADMYISTLRSYIRAMGGDLQIRAVFPDGEVQINQFQELVADEKAPVRVKRKLKVSA